MFPSRVVNRKSEIRNSLECQLVKWRARRESNPRPSAFRRRRTLARRACENPLQFLAPLPGFQIPFASHGGGTCLERLLIDQLPWTAIPGGLGDPAIVLAKALNHVGSEPHVVPAGSFTAEDVNEEHQVSGAPGGSRTPDLLVSAAGGLYPAGPARIRFSSSRPCPDFRYRSRLMAAERVWSVS